MNTISARMEQAIDWAIEEGNAEALFYAMSGFEFEIDEMASNGPMWANEDWAEEKRAELRALIDEARKALE